MARARRPEGERPPADAVETGTAQLRQGVAAWVVGMVVGRFSAFYAAIFLGIGGLVLAVGWHAGPHKYLESREFHTLTVRAPARIVESWVAIEFDPAQMGAYTQWRAFARASPCIVAEYDAGWGTPQRRAFCGSRVAFYDHYTLHDIAEVTPGVPFAWTRDGRGFVVPELRVSKAALAYLDTRPHVTHVPSEVDPGTELARLRSVYARPVDHAIVGWGRPDPDLTVAIDPARPAEAWPVGYVEASQRKGPDGVMAAMGAIMGLAFWFSGIRILAGGHRWPMILLVGALPLLWLPWFTEKIPRTVASMNAEFGQVIGEMMGTVEGYDRFVASSPQEATLAHGERIALPGETIYAESLGKFALAVPTARPADQDAALLALADAVASRMRALDDDSRAAIFSALTREKLEGRTGAGFAFLRAAREALVAPDTPPAARAQARRFLDAWVTQPVDEPWPDDVGFAARLQLLRELTQLPRPDDVAVRAGWILERGEARQREKR